MDENDVKAKSISNIIKTTLTLSRYMTLETFCKCIQNDSMIFSKPFVWRESYDPFEDILSNFQTDTLSLDIANNIFAQCWNSGDECDGMWRNYASLENGVMIRTTESDVVEQLIDFVISKGCFQNTDTYRNDTEIINQLSNDIKFFRVEYIDTNNIVSKMESLLEFNNSDINQNLEKLLTSGNYIKLLSYKRKHYEYEKEYRIVLQAREPLIIDNSDKIFVTGFKKLVNEIIFSPKFDECQFEFYKNKLLNTYGFKNEQIKKSDLYDVKKFLKNSKLKLKE